MQHSGKQDSLDTSAPSLAEEGHPSRRFHIRKGKTNPRRLAYLTLLMFAHPRPVGPCF